MTGEAGHHQPIDVDIMHQQQPDTGKTKNGNAALGRPRDHQEEGQDKVSENNYQADYLPTAAPWGQAFPEPQFHGEFVVIDVRMVGQQHDHCRLTVDIGNGQKITAMAFRQQQPDWLTSGSKVILYYRLSVNEFRQQRNVQLLVDGFLSC